MRRALDATTSFAMFAIVTGFALATSACAPSLPSLMREQRYPEAICKIYDSSRNEAVSAESALAALGRPRWRLHRIVPDVTQLGDPVAAQFFESHAVFRIETQADPIAGLQPLFPTPTPGKIETPAFGMQQDAVDLLDLGSIAWLTGETVPVPHDVITHIDWGAVLLAASTAGFSLPYAPLDMKTTEVVPTPTEIAAAVPHAIAIQRVLQSESFPLVGWWFASKKNGNDVLHFELSAALESTHAPWGDDSECRHALVVRFAPVDVPMPDGDAWPAGKDFHALAWQQVDTIDASGHDVEAVKRAPAPNAPR